ncbi:MAG: LysE family translocator [Sutterellaceae bacterium]|nr:LysE family translocator [Sutterellaceae bacterium]
MTLENLLLYIPVAFLIVVMPGPDFAIVSKVALTQGRLAGCACAIGVACGILIHTLLAIVGISAVVAHSVTLFSALKWIGAAYLFWLGIQAVRASFSQSKATAVDFPQLQAVPETTLSRLWLQGFLCNVLNPKAVLFFLTFLPQFMTPHEDLTPQFLILGGILMSFCAIWFSSLSFLLGYIGEIFKKPRFQNWLNRVTGGIFLLFGLKLALTQTP